MCSDSFTVPACEYTLPQANRHMQFRKLELNGLLDFRSSTFLRNVRCIMFWVFVFNRNVKNRIRINDYLWSFLQSRYMFVIRRFPPTQKRLYGVLAGCTSTRDTCWGGGGVTGLQSFTNGDKNPSVGTSRMCWEYKERRGRGQMRQRHVCRLREINHLPHLHQSYFNINLSALFLLFYWGKGTQHCNTSLLS